MKKRSRPERQPLSSWVARISPARARTLVLVHKIGKPFVVPPCSKTRNYSRGATLADRCLKPEEIYIYRPYPPFSNSGDNQFHDRQGDDRGKAKLRAAEKCYIHGSINITERKDSLILC
jgi:hypothetical protein